MSPRPTRPPPASAPAPYVPLPWTNVYGLARALVALGTAGTLAASSAETLFRPVATIGDYPSCNSTTDRVRFSQVDLASHERGYHRGGGRQSGAAALDAPA